MVAQWMPVPTRLPTSPVPNRRKSRNQPPESRLFQLVFIPEAAMPCAVGLSLQRIQL